MACCYTTDPDTTHDTHDTHKTGDEDDESKRLSTLLLSGSGSGIGGSAVRDKKKEKKKKKKSDNDLLSAKGINVQAASRGELRGIVPYARPHAHAHHRTRALTAECDVGTGWMISHRSCCGSRCLARQATLRS